MTPKPYVYFAEILRVVDGDTIDVMIDKGFGDYSKERLRLARIDAWEPKGDEREKGKAATAFVKELLPVGDTVIIKTEKNELFSDSFGRYLMEVYLMSGENLGDMLLKEGHAVLYGEK